MSIPSPSNTVRAVHRYPSQHFQASHYPSGYWKIIFTNSTPIEGTLAVFIMDRDAPRAASFRSYQATAEEIEQRSGLRGWTTLPEADQAALKTIRGQQTKDTDC